MENNIPRQFGKGKKVFNWTDEIIQEMVRLYNEEFWSFTEIGKKYNLNKITVNRKLQNYGVKNRTHLETKKLQSKKQNKTKRNKRPHKTILTLDDEAQICQFYKKGMGKSKLGITYKIGKNRVEEILAKYHIQERKGLGDCGNILSEEIEKEICKVYQNREMGQHNICLKFNIAEKRLKTILTKYDIPILDHSTATQIRVDNYKPIKEQNAQKKIDAKIKRKETAAQEWLQKELAIVDAYINQKLASNKIKEKLHTSMETVLATLKKYNIPYRERHEWDMVPIGSWGICGVYKGMNFKSMKELSFIINYLEKKNIPINDGEKRKGIRYYNSNKKRFRKYYPDFYTDKFIIEIKPKSFWETAEVIDKSIVGFHFAKENGLEYRLVDYPIIPTSIVEKFLNNELQFTEKQRARFKKNYSKWLPD